MSGLGLTNPCPLDNAIFISCTGLTTILIIVLTNCKVEKGLLRRLERQLSQVSRNPSEGNPFQRLIIYCYGADLLREFRWHNWSNLTFTIAAVGTYLLWLARCRLWDPVVGSIPYPELGHGLLIALILFRIWRYVFRLERMEQVAARLL
jgi:hypothetical protein